jgi:hypothetical protein
MHACAPPRVALETELIKCQGKTPEATMASALYTDVKRKLSKSVFTRYVSKRVTIARIMGWEGGLTLAAGTAAGTAGSAGLMPSISVK